VGHNGQDIHNDLPELDVDFTIKDRVNSRHHNPPTALDGYRELIVVPDLGASIGKFEFRLQPTALESNAAQMDSLLRRELREIFYYLIDTYALCHPGNKFVLAKCAFRLYGKRSGDDLRPLVSERPRANVESVRKRRSD
jgi:hypothetical protein